MALVITSQNFEETIQSPQLVMIDFWATWCGPCRALAPTIEELAEEYKGKMVIAKCDIDENNEIAVQFGIMSIPTVLFIKNGEVVEKQVGLVPKANLKKIIDSLL
ncbi:MAG: thioredoxin [Bacteroidales bacterium]|nr:thioredoxin [Bacteroidales bacterium]